MLISDVFRSVSEQIENKYKAKETVNLCSANYLKLDCIKH